MKKLWLSFLLLLPLASSAPGGVPCTLPFNLQNGTPADATQVMANYNALVTCLSQAAIAGANNDITALTALTTPISPAQGGTPVYTGGTAGGTANDLTVTPVVPSGFALQAGRVVTFIVAANNSSVTTINVAGTGVRQFYRRTQLGLAPMVGGELVVGEAVTAYYDGTNFQLMNSALVYIGEIKDFANVAVPPGWAALDGSCQSRTGPMAGLFVVIGTTFDPTGSTCDSANFALPDARGRVLAGVDTLGTRLTTAGSGCNGTALGGAGCGVQNQTLVGNQLPDLTFQTGSTLALTNATVAIFEPGGYSNQVGSCPGGVGTCGHTHFLKDPGVNDFGTCTLPGGCGHSHQLARGDGTIASALEDHSPGATPNYGTVGGGPVDRQAAAGTLVSAAAQTQANVTARTDITGVSAAIVNPALTGFLRPRTAAQTVTPTVPPTLVVNKIIKF